MNLMRGFVCLVLFVCFSVGIEVKCSVGTIQGFTKENADCFLGIPYAHATRLRSSSYLETLGKDPFPGLSFGAACPQKCNLGFNVTCGTQRSEDCLFINVFRPSATKEEEQLLPVILFVPGGDFIQGSGGNEQFDASEFVSNEDVVFVTMNYRLGALGFLVLDDNTELNFGVGDQLNAMLWVQKNIASFGGDPKRVTLMGQSAGASSIAYHLTVSGALEKGYFQKAISESNPMAVPFRTRDRALDEAKVFLKNVGCSDMSCVLQKSVSQILSAQEETLRHFTPLHPLSVFYAFSPVVETQPFQLLIQGNASKVPLLFGTLSNETNLFAGDLKNGISEVEYLAAIADLFPLHVAEVLEKFPPKLLGNATLTLAYLMTQYVFRCANERAFEKFDQAYQYFFEHPMSFGKAYWGSNALCWNYTCHAGELAFVFGTSSFLGFQPTKQEEAMSASMQQYWSNFAYSGNPNEGPNKMPAQWPLRSSSSHMFIGTPTVHSSQNDQDCSFLNRFY